jgi:hypothetical protein
MIPPDREYSSGYSTASVQQLSATSVQVSLSIINMSYTPNNYVLTWSLYSFPSYNVVSSQTTSTNSFSPITGLVAGGDYKFEIAVSGSGSSSTSSTYLTLATYSASPTGTPFGQAGGNTGKLDLNLPENAASARLQAEADAYFAAHPEIDKLTGGLIQTKLDSSTSTTSTKKSYLKLSNKESDFKLNKYKIDYRQFLSINNASYTNVSLAGSTNSELVPSVIGENYYSFGSSIFMQNSIEVTNAAGGIGFFIDPLSGNGYYLIIQTTTSAASNNAKSVQIVKFYNGNIILLKEIGTRTKSTIEGIYGGKQYDIDVKVKVIAQKVIITAYVNGYKITAEDINTKNTTKGSLGVIKILQSTNKVALICSRGTVAYDYVYAKSINDKQYDQSEYVLNIYKGRFSNDLINNTFGDLVYTDKLSADEAVDKANSIDEFGTVVREIYKIKVKYNNRPSFPVSWGVGANTGVSILGQTISNFDASAYVLNNSSTVIPLADDIGNSFYLIGNDLGDSGELEYETELAVGSSNVEPLAFKSTWLQNNNDVKLLAEWIKLKAVNRGRTVDLKVFGNPLISVGDIVTVKHTYAGLAGTENLIVTNVNQEFSDGLETTIACRSL